MLSFQDYLLRYQIHTESLTKSELTQVRTEFKREYARVYQQKLRSRMKRVEFLATTEEHQQIKKIAKQYGEGIGVFSRKAILAYTASEIYLPSNPALETTKLLIRRSSNNVNQLVKASHIQKYIDNQRLAQLVSELTDMETALNQFYQQPKIVFKPIHHIPNAH